MERNSANYTPIERGAWPNLESPPRLGAPSLRFFYARVGDHKSHLPCFTSQSHSPHFPLKPVSPVSSSNPDSALRVPQIHFDSIAGPGSDAGPEEILIFRPDRSRGAPGLAFETWESAIPTSLFHLKPSKAGLYTCSGIIIKCTPPKDRFSGSGAARGT